MGLSIKNKDVEALVDDVTRLTQETKTEAIRTALQERKNNLLKKGLDQDKRTRVMNFLENRLWSSLKEKCLLPPLSKAEEEELLGY